MFKLLFNAFVLFIFFSVDGYSQSVASLTDLQKQETSSLLANGQSFLYNGYNFYDYAPNYFEKGDAFFLNKNWISGNVNYGGTIYNQVPLKYDLIKDELIVQHFDKLSSINLIPHIASTSKNHASAKSENGKWCC
jgi:hypothetical protein